MDIECIFCHSGIQVGHKGYIFHLYQYHQIRFDMDHVLHRTRDLLQVQKAKLNSSTMNSTIVDILDDIIENVTGNPRTMPQFFKPVNQSIEDINANKFDHPLEDLNISFLVSDKYRNDSDKSFGIKLDKPVISDDHVKLDYSDKSFFSYLGLMKHFDEAGDNFDEFNKDLNKSNISDSLDISDKEEMDSKSFSDAKNKIMFNCFVKIQDIRKKSDKIPDLNLREKRKHATAFSEELNVTNRRKSARLDAKTNNPSNESEPNFTAEKSRVKKEKCKTPTENHRNDTEKANITGEKSKLMAEKTKVTAEKIKVTAEKPKVIVETNKVMAEKSNVTTAKIGRAKLEVTEEIKLEDAVIKIEVGDGDNEEELFNDPAISNSTGIPWYHGTIYTCQLCTKQFIEKKLFKKHMEGEHNVLGEDYLEKSRQSNTHECELCGKGFSWYRHNIQTHLTKNHSISINNYYEKFKDDIMLPNLNITDETLLSRFGSNSDHEWANQCTFQCALCNQKFNSKRKFGKHLKSHHQLCLKEYSKDYGKSLLHEEKHHCQIESCDTVIIWDKHSILGHLKNVHDFASIEDYKEKYMDNYVEKASTNNTKKQSLNSLENDNDWSNKCIFTCALCQTEFNSSNNFGNHLRSQHEITITEYSKEYGTYISHEEKHSCQIENCNAKMWWDRKKIWAHLYKGHDKMSIEDYKEKYMDNYVEKASTNNTEKQSLNRLENDTDWSNKCNFTCKLCKVEFKSNSNFRNHLNRQHEITITEYSKVYGTSISYEEKHSCQVENCNAKMWWDRKRIKAHLYNAHQKMPIEDYKEKYMDNYVEKASTNNTEKQSLNRLENANDWSNKCNFTCELCKVEFKSHKNFANHLNRQHEITMTEYSKDYGTSISHEEKHSCQVENCNAKMWWDRERIRAHIYGAHDKMSIEDYRKKYMDGYVEKESVNNAEEESMETYNDWSNKCISKCALCQTDFNSRNNFGKHVRQQHEITVTEYSKDYGTSIFYEKMHSCQVENCSSNVWWDRRSIMNHLYEAHDKLSIDEYKKKYMSNYKDKVEIQTEGGNSKKFFTENSDQSWANRCIYKCNICEKTFKVRKTFRKHVVTQHQISNLEYVNIYGRTMAHEEKHTCQVEDCGSQFWWTGHSFMAHFKLKHANLNLNEYQNKYMQNYQEKLIDQNSKLKTAKPIFQNYNKYSECQLSCNICKLGKVFYSREKAGAHMKAIHGINLKQYKTEHGSSISFKVNHTCHICATIILWDKSAISNHLYGVHDKLTISEYFEKFINNFEDDTKWFNKTSLQCKECEEKNMFSTHNRLELWKHIKKIHNKTEMEYRSIHGSIYSPVLPEMHTCQICFEKINWESISLKPHIELKHQITIKEYVSKFKDSYKKKQGLAPQKKTDKESHVQKKVDNEVEDEEVLKWTTGSLFLCKICDKGVAGLHQFKKHLETRHETNYKKYEKTYQTKDFVLFEGFHICTICQKNVRHDKMYLENHMKEHDKTIREYIDEYKPKPPKLDRMMKDRQATK